MTNTFVMMTRLMPTELRSLRSLEELESSAMKQVRSACPEVEWVANYALLGPYDYLDVFKAPGFESALKVAALVRSFGHTHTEVWPPWKDFKALVRHLPGPEGLIER